MSQRSKRRAVMEEEAVDDECSRLRQMAQDQNICSKKRRICTHESALPKHLESADSKDILKKSSTRKGRYLFHISLQLKPAVGGRLGTLANLDSQNPVMYVDFPLGRLKMIGTLLFPKSKYLLLKFGTKDVLCEDVFDSVVLFAEMYWVGTKDANPSEAPLELPVELQQAIARESPAAGEAKAASGTPARRRRSPAADPGSPPASQPATHTASQPATQPALQRSRGISEPRSVHQRKVVAKRKKAALDTSEEDSDANDADVADPPLSQRQHLGRSSKTAAQRRLLEADSDEEEEVEIRSDSQAGSDGSDSDAAAACSLEARADSDGESGGSLQPASQAAPASQRAAGRKRPAPIPAVALDEEEAEVPPKRQRKPAAARRSKAARKRIVNDSDESPAEEDDEHDEDFTL